MKNAILTISIWFFVILGLTVSTFASTVTVKTPNIVPNPLNTVENNGEGTISFILEGKGRVPAVPINHQDTPNVRLSIELQKLKLKNDDISGLKGTLLNYFDVSYNENEKRFVFKQKLTMATSKNLNITIPVTVTANSTQNSENGFNVNINASDSNTEAVGHTAKFVKTVAKDIVCGNGILEAGEACDDANTRNGDGCNSVCKIESKFGDCQKDSDCASNDCNANTQRCQERYIAVCGNGILDTNEACDDNNTINGDECNSVCKIETTEGNNTEHIYKCETNANCASSYCNDSICMKKPAPEKCSGNSVPEARDDHVTVNAVNPSVLNVQENDIARETVISEGSTRIINAEGKEVTEFTIEGKAKCTVNTETGTISFIPVDVCEGSTEITYTIKDECNKVSNQAKLYITCNSDCSTTKVKDNASALGNISFMVLMLLTSVLGLLYLRREELRNKSNF